MLVERRKAQAFCSVLDCQVARDECCRQGRGTGAAWGVLEVDSTRHRDFSQDAIEFLTATAALIGAFLQGHRQEPSEAATSIVRLCFQGGALD